MPLTCGYEYMYYIGVCSGNATLTVRAGGEFTGGRRKKDPPGASRGIWVAFRPSGHSPSNSRLASSIARSFSAPDVPLHHRAAETRSEACPGRFRLTQAAPDPMSDTDRIAPGRNLRVPRLPRRRGVLMSRRVSFWQQPCMHLPLRVYRSGGVTRGVDMRYFALLGLVLTLAKCGDC